MSIDLIVLGNELTAVYFFLCHDTLSVVGYYYYTKSSDSVVNRITNLIKNEVSDKIVQDHYLLGRIDYS